MQDGYYESPNQYGQAGYNHNIKPKKKGIKTLIIIAVILLLMCCGGVGIVISVIMSAAKPKDPIDITEVILIAQDLGYDAYEGNSQEYLAFYKDGYITELEVSAWSSEELAKSDVEVFTDVYELENARSSSKMTGTNYEKYTWSVDSSYYFVYRVDETVIRMHSDNKENIEAFVDKMNF